MKVYHVSPRKGIKTLDPRRSKGKHRAVWFACPSLLAWAVRHVAEHQKADRLYIYEAQIDRRACRRFRRGIYLSFRPVPAVLVGRAEWTLTFNIRRKA